LTLARLGGHRGAMSENTPQVNRKRLLLLLALVGVGALVALGLLLRVMTVHEIIAAGRGFVDRVLVWFRTIGPGPYFVAMALLPAAGFPVMAFSLSAGPVFTPQLGLGWVVTWVVISLGVNIALTYWLARYALRPLIEGIVKRMGYELPQVQTEDHLALALLCRITPGPPFFVQSYLLGLAEVPFWTYLWVSWLISSIYSVSLVVFGDSLMQGSGKVAFFAVSIFVAVMVAIKMVRRHFAKKKVEAA